MNKTYCLRYGTSTILYVKFYDRGKDCVHVHGCLGAAEYVDKDMTREEARSYWSGLSKDGWVKVNPKTAPRDWWFWN